ncbi:MAG: class I mannose-6-phosphate isomerase [Kiritimatiellae bacterium]|nr:class I mannose-6-phosphate isomerase [Kiritimatiellia bacterium]
MNEMRLVFREFVHRALWGRERWEISAHRSDPGVVADGPLAGRRLDELFPGFPLLFKEIDARDRLSVQVHPNGTTCRLAGGEPKSEMWCALSDGPVFAGLRPGTDAAAVRDAVASGRFEEILVRHDLRAGDAVFIPGGLVHAVGGGARLYEVQQSSDTTFRLYDWGRVGADGRPRELHLAQALLAMDPGLPAPEPRTSLDTPFFAFSQTRLSGEMPVRCAEDEFLAVRSADGAFSLDGEGMASGRSLLLPPGSSGCLRADGAWLLTTRFRRRAGEAGRRRGVDGGRARQ